jgi:hypothetical protein
LPKFHLTNRERWKLEKDDQRGRLARSRDGCIARSGAGWLVEFFGKVRR